MRGGTSRSTTDQFFFFIKWGGGGGGGRTGAGRAVVCRESGRSGRATSRTATHEASQLGGPEASGAFKAGFSGAEFERGFPEKGRVKFSSLLGNGFESWGRCTLDNEGTLCCWWWCVWKKMRRGSGRPSPSSSSLCPCSVFRARGRLQAD